MNNKKHIVDLESFREMLHICPMIPGQAFAKLPFEEEILEFIWFFRHGETIRTLTDKSNEMHYPRFTKVIIHHFMSKDSSIPRRNKINWHYVRDDSIFSTIKVVSRHQNTQQYGAMLPIDLTNDEIKNSKAYKEYYAFATRKAVPKPKASARRKRSGFDASITPPTATTTLTTTVAATPKLPDAAKGKQPAKAKSTDEGTGSKPRVPDVPTDESEKELLWNSSDDEGADDQEKVGDNDEGDEDNYSEEGEEKDDDDQDQEVAKHDDKDDTEESGNVNEEGGSNKEDDDEETRDEESFDPIPQTPESSEDEGDGKEDQGLRISEEERLNEEEKAEELYIDVNINQGRGIQETLDVEDSHVTLTLVHPDGQQESSSVSS
nr:hypothetical protein [Tanacetum cinerariifolium]